MARAQGSSLDWRNLAVVALGIVFVGVVGMQIMSAPAGPASAASTRSEPAETAARETVARPDLPERLALAGDHPIRPLFRPLVSEPRPGAASPPGGTPVLPSAAGAPAAAPAAAAPAPPAAPAAPPVPKGPQIREIRMLGIVELDGQPQALLKHAGTGESRYFAVGEEAFGFRVEAIAEDSVSLTLSGKAEKVLMSSDVVIDGPGGSSAASSSLSASRGDDSRGDRRSERRSERRGRDEGDASSSVLAQVMSAPPEERLKKLEEVKDQLEPERYERLKNFFSRRAGR